VTIDTNLQGVNIPLSLPVEHAITKAQQNQRELGLDGLNRAGLFMPAVLILSRKNTKTANHKAQILLQAKEQTGLEVKKYTNTTRNRNIVMT
jgi:hypothetical protein